MNWVGRPRDRLKRSKETERKQKEFFAQRKLEQLQEKQRNRYKKGISRDLLNLECVTKTIRNPFDEPEIGDDMTSKVKKNQKEFSSVAIVGLSSCTKRKYSQFTFPLQSKKEILPSYQSTPIVHKVQYFCCFNPSLALAFFIHLFLFQSDGCNRKSTNLYSTQKNAFIPPSPIHSENISPISAPTEYVNGNLNTTKAVCWRSPRASIHSITPKSGNMLLVDGASHSSANEVCSTEPSSFIHLNTLCSDGTNNNFVDVDSLHGVPSAYGFIKQEFDDPNDTQSALSASRYDQYDIFPDSSARNSKSHDSYAYDQSNLIQLMSDIYENDKSGLETCRSTDENYSRAPQASAGSEEVDSDCEEVFIHCIPPKTPNMERPPLEFPKQMIKEEHLPYTPSSNWETPWHEPGHAPVLTSSDQIAEAFPQYNQAHEFSPSNTPTLRETGTSPVRWSIYNAVTQTAKELVERGSSPILKFSMNVAAQIDVIDV
ncbi:uncharacterized protein LOC143444321 isoform X2 [Clavelina lepadiformis]|uniref:uncharacterized protein LOC143444321 isoform X2 n=1 Tax=Clavelina lepadiformis TaxID=159417 RepID=UPI004041A9CC